MLRGFLVLALAAAALPLLADDRDRDYRRDHDSRYERGDRDDERWEDRRRRGKRGRGYGNGGYGNGRGRGNDQYGYGNDRYGYGNDRYGSRNRSYGNGYGAVDRAMNNLQRLGSWGGRMGSHERNHVNDGLKYLSRFRNNSGFDRSSLDKAIENIEHLAQTNDLGRQNQQVLSRDLYALRDLRNSGRTW